MGMFNGTIETKTLSKKQTVYLTCETEETISGLVRWKKDTANGFRLDGENIIVSQNCCFIIIVDGIKETTGEATLAILKNGVKIQSYKESSRRKLNLLRVCHSGYFKARDELRIQFQGLKNIQVIIYGNI